MSERDDLIANLRQLIELDRGFGVEFLPAAPTLGSLAAPVAPASRPALATRPVAPDGTGQRVSAPVTRAPVRPTPPPAPRPSSAATGPLAPIAPAPRAPAARAPAVAIGPTATPPSADRWTPAPGLLDLPPADALAAIAADVAPCRRCGLCATRTRTVPGEGSASAELLFIGEGPGADEDKSGRPFVGAAGELLDKMIVAMGLRRADVFIANVVKCRPPGNRVPEPVEVAQCLPFLQAQIAVLKPKVICSLGNVPLKALFGEEIPGITRSRGQRLVWQGIPVFPTFHPSYLLRNPAAKKPCWEDLQAVLRELGRLPPGK
jgi:uracil-DNA glycosylase family 4